MTSFLQYFVKRLRTKLLVSICLMVCCALPSIARTSVDNLNSNMWPGAVYDETVPTIEQELGFNVGEQITTGSEMLSYLRALEQAAPDRISIHEYGKTWQGRPLVYAVIGKADHLKQLETFKKNIKSLADPRQTSQSQAQNIIENTPAFVWLQYSVHGNEISGTDAAMMLAYHLLAVENDEIVDNILDNTIVFIDPLQNPDGRARFVSRYYATVGLEHSSDRFSAEHNEPWPRGRTNHYLFDLNRDWLAITQPETKHKIALINEYTPQVIVDVHEMGGDQSYYFAPAAEPFNPYLSEAQIANMNTIGRNHAKHFDALGFDYFTREIFDAFYPGYGDSWPAFYGASASTYEVGSARGHKFQKKNGQLLTFWDTVQQQFVASLSTAEGAAKIRKKLLNDFYEYQLSSIAAGKKSKQRYYILPAQNNREGTHRLATLMAEHGVEVSEAQTDFKACGTEYSNGSFIIDTAQPRGTFTRMVFDEQVDMAKPFLKEQERLRARNLPDQIYDVTAWSLPMMFNVDTVSCSKLPKLENTTINANTPLPGKLVNPDASVAFVVKWGDTSASRFLSAALRAGITVKSSDEAFVLDGKHTYSAGSLIIERRTNQPDLAQKLSEIALQTGTIVQGVETSWVTSGPSFGSGRTVTMKPPKIAMAWDSPTSSLSAGNTRFVIERQLNYPVTAIRTSMLGSADLSNYQVLILPEGRYSTKLHSSTASNIKQWVEQGGVLIALGNATRFISSLEKPLLNAKLEQAYRNNEVSHSETFKVEGTIIDTQETLLTLIEEPDTTPDYVSGFLANIDVDQEHWLTAGVDSRLVMLARGNEIYSPITLGVGKNLAWFADEKELLASGYVWEENKAQMAFKPVLMHQALGKGMVIAFTQSPTFRAYLEGMNILLSNSIFRAPAHAN